MLFKLIYHLPFNTFFFFIKCIIDRMLYVKYALYFQYEILCVVVRYYLLMILLNISAKRYLVAFCHFDANELFIKYSINKSIIA